MTTNPAPTADRTALREAFAEQLSMSDDLTSFTPEILAAFDAALAATPAPEADSLDPDRMQRALDSLDGGGCSDPECCPYPSWTSGEDVVRAYREANRG